MTVDKKENSDAEGNEASSKVNLDTILVEEIGQFGKFQRRVLLMNVVVVVFTSWAASEYVFTTARISTRCLIPECDGAEPEFRPSWVSNAIPESSGALDNCQRYGNTSQANLGDTCPASLFDQTQLMPCQELVYENTHTVVYDFDLGCDEWRRTFIGSIRTGGTVLALPITGYISDRWGRRVALTFNAVNTAWLGCVRYFANTFTGYTISEVIESTLGSGVFSSAYILLMEITGPKYRVPAACTMHTFFSIGQMLMGLIAWGVPNWRLFTLTLYVPMLVSIAYIWLMTESLRWYMSKGKYKESEELLQKIAKTNGKTLSPKSLEALRQTNEEEKRLQELEKMNNEKTPWLIVLVFRHKKILLRCLVAPVWWITGTFIYYGLSINAVNISGNRYANYIAVAAADVPGYWTAVFLMGRIGRKPVLTGALWLCAACQVANIFLPEAYYGLSLAFYLFGKCCIACGATAQYVYTAELFPTKYRHSLFSFAAMTGQIGAIAAPLTPAFGAATFEAFPFVLFGSFAFISGILVFFTPETFGSPLSDTMEEAENIGMKKKKHTDIPS